MPNITVTVSESSYRDARVWAALHNTSVSAIVQYYIERLPNLRASVEAAAATGRHRKQQQPASSAPAAAPSAEPVSSGTDPTPLSEKIPAVKL
jgi:hypothetical protein